MRAIRLFIAEGEGVQGKGSAGQGSSTFEKAPQRSVTYQVPEPASALVREEEFAKQLRLARYLAGTSLGSPRAMGKADERTRSVTKPKESDYGLEGSEFESRRLHGVRVRGWQFTVRSLSHPSDGFAFY